jgi:hypothetical protein
LKGIGQSIQHRSFFVGDQRRQDSPPNAKQMFAFMRDFIGKTYLLPQTMFRGLKQKNTFICLFGP